MINERIFGAPIPKKIAEKLEKRQEAAAGPTQPGDSLTAVFPDADGNTQADLSSRTPFVRMWTSLKIIEPAIAFTEEAGYMEVTLSELIQTGVTPQSFSGPVDLELAYKLLAEVQRRPAFNHKTGAIIPGSYLYKHHRLTADTTMGAPRVIIQPANYVKPGSEQKFYIAYNEDRDQLSWTRQIYIIGDHAYQENYGKVDTNESLDYVENDGQGNHGNRQAPSGTPLGQPGQTMAQQGGLYTNTDPHNKYLKVTHSNNQVTYYSSDLGNEHFPQQLKYNPLMKPNAGITSVTSTTEGALGVIKKTTVNFVVHNFYDYDRIYNKYFLKPGATIFIDFGWSSVKELYNPEDLIGEFDYDNSTPAGASTKLHTQAPLVDIQQKLFDDVDGIVTNEQGDLEVLQGLVTDYNSKILPNGSVECSVTLTSANSALINFKTDAVTSSRVESILKNGILLAGLRPLVDDIGAVSTTGTTTTTGNEQCTHNNAEINLSTNLYTKFDINADASHLKQENCEDPNKQQFTGQSSIGFWRDPNNITGGVTRLADDNDLKELLSYPDANSSPATILEYQKNLRLLAQQLLSSTGPAPVGNSIRTGIFVDNLNAENSYMSWGLFEDLIINSQFGHGKNLADIQNGKNFQVRLDSSTSFTSFSKGLLEKQRVLSSIPDEPPTILYPEWWSIADPHPDKNFGIDGGSYNWQQKKHPTFDYNERYEADLEAGVMGKLNTERELVDGDISSNRIPLREVFISTDKVLEAFKSNNSVMKIINSLLKNLNEDSDGIFKWKLITGSTDSEFKIVDIHYISILEKISEKLDPNQPKQGFNTIDPADNPFFTFRIMSPFSIVKDYNLEFKLPNNSIGAMYAIQGMSHDTSVISIDDELDDVIGLTSLDIDSNIIIYEPDQGKYRIENLTAGKKGSNDYNVYQTVDDIVSSNTWNISGVVQQDVLKANLSVPDPLTKEPIKPVSGTPVVTPSATDLIKVNDDLMRNLGFVVATSFTEFYEIKNRGQLVEENRPNLLPYTLTLTMYGIASIVPGDTFKVDYLPLQHLNHTFLQTIKVSHNIDSTGWYTTLDTQYRLLPNAKQIAIKGRGKNRQRLSASALNRLPLFNNSSIKYLKILTEYITDIRITSSPVFDFIMDFKTGDMSTWVARINEATSWWQKALPGLIAGFSPSSVRAMGLITNQATKGPAPNLKDEGYDLIQFSPTLTKRMKVIGWEKYTDGDVQFSVFTITAQERRWTFFPVPVDIAQKNNQEFRMVYLDGAYMLFDKQHPNYKKIFKFFNTTDIQTWDADSRARQHSPLFFGAPNPGATGTSLFTPR